MEDGVELVTDTDVLRVANGSPFAGAAVLSYSHVVVAGLRYGASTAHRGRNYCHAYINGRDAVRIDRICSVSHLTPGGKMLVANIAVVRPFINSEHIAEMPWAMQYVNPGVVPSSTDSKRRVTSILCSTVLQTWASKHGMPIGMQQP